MSRLRRNRPAFQGGFSLLEVVAVLVVLGFLSAVALSRFSNLNSNAYSDGETLKATLRYIRTRAMSDIYTWQITVAGTTGTVTRNTTPPQSYTITFATSGVAAGTTTFDNLGQPSGTLSYTVTGYPGSPVTVTAGSGYVP